VTIWDVLATARRLWLVTLAGLLLTAGGLALVSHQPGVYNGQVNAVLLTRNGATGNALVDTTSSLVATTGLVARVMGDASSTNGTVSTQVPLASEGVELGYSVRQQDSGGQWEPIFSDPVLDVQSTGPTLASAQVQMGVALAKVQAALDVLENRAGVAPYARIEIQLSPGQPVYVYAHGSRARAVGAVLLAGMMVTVGGLLAVDGALRRRRRGSAVGAAHPSQSVVRGGTTLSDALRPG
jgi:hypothetical protein